MLGQVGLGLGRAEKPQLREGLFTYGGVFLPLGDLNQFILRLRVEQPDNDWTLRVCGCLGVHHRQLLTPASLPQRDNRDVPDALVGFRLGDLHERRRRIARGERRHHLIFHLLGRRCVDLQQFFSDGRTTDPSEFADRNDVNLIVTTGGTGLGPRDNTPEATQQVIEREVPGIAEAIRAESLKSTPMAMISRGVCGVRSGTLIVNLPGSPKAVKETFAVIAPVLSHAIELLSGRTSHNPR